MLSVFYIVLTFLALLLIPGLFIDRRLSVPLSLTNILRFIKISASKYDDEEERNDKGGAMGWIRERSRMPKHVAVILDGNRRWAEKRGLGTSEGHKAGASRLMENAKDCFAMGTTTISLFAFSTENWERPEDEVNCLMALFENHFKSEMPYFQRSNQDLSHREPHKNLSLLGIIRDVEEATKSYEGKHLIIAIKARDGEIEVEDINEEAMEKELMTKCGEFPNPDLLIRTSGEQRISNFFLWQSAYTELYFTSVLWPDFGEAEYLEALTWYQQRQRLFGRRV